VNRQTNAALSRRRVEWVAGMGQAAGVAALLIAADDLSALGRCCFSSKSASSGQISCQSSGRRSRRETSPSVARSIGTHRSIGTSRFPVDHCEISTGEAPIAVASSIGRPATSFVHSRNFMRALLAMREGIAIAMREFLFSACRYRIRRPRHGRAWPGPHHRRRSWHRNKPDQHIQHTQSARPNARTGSRSGAKASTSPRYRNRLRDRSIHRKDFPKIAISARHQHRQQAVFFRLWKIFRVSLLTGA
jgi:hypothetical protein